MSSESSLLPWKWFAATAALSLLLAGIAASLLLAPHPRQSKAGPAPTTLSLRQRDDNGLQLPWGTTTSGTNVRIEVAGADPERVTEIELLLSRNGAPAERLEHAGNGADLKQLAPGRYRWSAVLQLRGNATTMLEPPRGDPLAADFVVAPQVLELPPLRQRAFEGEETIEKGARTRRGAKLGTEFASPMPGTVLEVEAKPLASTFDGTRVQRIGADKGDACIEFTGPDGEYHWRARLVAAANLQTQWQAFGGGPAGDFIIVDAAAQDHTPPGNDDSDDAEDGAGDASGKNQGGGKNSSNPNKKHNPTGKNNGAGDNSNTPPEHPDPDAANKNQIPSQNFGTAGHGGTLGKSYSSGIGGGYARPLPSRVRPLASLWHLALLRMALIFGGIIAAPAVLLIAIRVIKSGRHRAPRVS